MYRYQMHAYVGKLANRNRARLWHSSSPPSLSPRLAPAGNWDAMKLDEDKLARKIGSSKAARMLGLTEEQVRQAILLLPRTILSLLFPEGVPKTRPHSNSKWFCFFAHALYPCMYHPYKRIQRYLHFILCLIHAVTLTVQCVPLPNVLNSNLT